MQVELEFLRSKVARRIFMLFVVCALIPIVVLSWVSTSFVTNQLDTQSRELLHRTTKSVGMEILGRVAVAESELRLTGAMLETGSDVRNSSGWRRLAVSMEAHFDALTVSGGSASPLQLIGTSGTSRTVDDLKREHLASGRAQLSTRSDGNRAPRIFLDLAVGEHVPIQRFLTGEIKADFLWGMRDEIGLPSGAELVVLDPEHNILFSSFRSPPVLSDAALAKLGGSFSGDLSWLHEDQEWTASYWSPFLGSQYASPSWTVILSISRADFTAPLAQFGRRLPKVVLLCLLIVVLLSFIQIRRSLVPLQKLRQGAEQIARRKFDTRVVVSSRDEFRQLADSFNTMAADLGRQFRTLETLAEIDRAILSTVREEDIVRTALERIPDHFPCDVVVVTVIASARAATSRSYARWTGSACEKLVWETTLSPEDHRNLTSAADSLLPGQDLPSHLTLLAEKGIANCLVLPILVRDQLAGCIALGYRRARSEEEDDRIEARRLANQVGVALSNAHLVEELEQANWETLHALARAVDANSSWTSGHSERVTAMAVELGQRMGLSEDELIVIHKGGLLHDIGKIGVPNEILDKPARLTEEEMRLMQDHTRIGARILEPISAYAEEIPIVLYHHERYDGSGYPEGLAGERIPRNARILAVADVFDALISERPYRAPWPLDRVIAFIRDESGTHFDPEVSSVFVDMMRERNADPTRTGAGSCTTLQPA